MVQIRSVFSALPPHQYDQETITAELAEHLTPDPATQAVLTRIHQSTGVRTRHLALPLERYRNMGSFTATNELYAEHALGLLSTAVRGALEQASLKPKDVDYLFFTTVTGLGAPALDVALHHEMGFRSDVKHVPSFGLGCVAGASGLARVNDYLVGHPNAVGLVASVELCSLTLQWDDSAMANLVGTGLFGDGAAAVVLVGHDRHIGHTPVIRGSRSSLYADSEEMIGWRIGEAGFRLMLQAGVPAMVEGHFAEDVDALLDELGWSRDDISVWCAHPGGPRILESFSEALDLAPGALMTSWDVMAETGNLSSAAVLHVLERELNHPKGTKGLLFALGPGISSEIIALEWTS
jgi:alkylresorcinol/alkylpyrone synthase